MTEQNPPSWMEGGSHPSKNDRNLLGALVQGEGIVKPTDLAVSFPSANMNVSIAAGDVFVLGDAARQGMYHCWNDAAVVKTLVNGESNPRKDLITAKLHDNFIDSGGLNTWTIDIVKGTAAASPVEPTIPANSYVLAMIDVPALITNLQASGVLNDRRGIAKLLSASVKDISSGLTASATSINTASFVDFGPTKILLPPTWCGAILVRTFLTLNGPGSAGTYAARNVLGATNGTSRPLNAAGSDGLMSVSMVDKFTTGFTPGQNVTLKTQAIRNTGSGTMGWSGGQNYTDFEVEYLVS